MSKFSVGDEVRYIGNTTGYRNMVGVVRGYSTGVPDEIRRYSVKGVPFPVREDRLELVAKGPFVGNWAPAAPAAPVATAPVAQPWSAAQENPAEQAAIAVAEADNKFWDKTVEAINARGALQAAQEALEKAEADQAKADAEKARKAAVLERLKYEAGLASGNGYLLIEIKAMVEGTRKPAPRTILATYRHELTPLAETYGYTLVPVGDHSEAVLSAI